MGRANTSVPSDRNTRSSPRDTWSDSAITQTRLIKVTGRAKDTFTPVVSAVPPCEDSRVEHPETVSSAAIMTPKIRIFSLIRGRAGNHLYRLTIPFSGRRDYLNFSACSSTQSACISQRPPTKFLSVPPVLGLPVFVTSKL